LEGGRVVGRGQGRRGGEEQEGDPGGSEGDERSGVG